MGVGFYQGQGNVGEVAAVVDGDGVDQRTVGGPLVSFSFYSMHQMSPYCFAFCRITFT